MVQGKKQKRKKGKKKSKPLCQTNIFVQCPGTRKSVRKKTDNARIRRGRLPPPEKSQTQIELEAEERRNTLRNIREDRLFSRDLENRRLELQRRQIDINFDNDRRNRQFRLAELELDREKFAVQTEIARQNKQSELRSRNTELRDIRERVARDDAFRHRQLEETQRLAFEQLAEKRKDNTLKRELEARKIENQRAVDADRAISDREREQTLQQTLNLLNRQQEVKPIETSPESDIAETPLSAISQTGSEIAAEAQSAAVKSGLRPSTEISLSPIITAQEQLAQEAAEFEPSKIQSDPVLKKPSPSPQVEPEPEPSTLSQQQTTSSTTEQRSKSLKLSPDPEQQFKYPIGTGGGAGRKQGGAGPLRGKEAQKEIQEREKEKKEKQQRREELKIGSGTFESPAGRALLSEIQQTERALETYQGLSTTPATETPLGADKFTQSLQTGE